MSTGNRQASWLEFANLDNFVGFLLTCVEEPSCGPGTEVGPQLDRLQYSHKLKRIYIEIQASASQVQLVSSIALANSGQVHNAKPQVADQIRTFDRQEFLRRVLLEQHSIESRSDQLLAAFQGARPDQLAPFLEAAGQLGARNMDVAFIAPGSARYSHLVRLRGIRDLKAFIAAADSSPVRIDLFTPVRSDRSLARFYVQLGWRYPIPGVDRLARNESELVLLRRDPERNATEWLAFAPGEINFFRRMAECVDLQLAEKALDLVVLNEHDDPRAVRMKLALGARPQGAPTQLVDIDRQIDRYQQQLNDLNRTRERLTTPELNEIYFAYRFEVRNGETLNPGLVSFLQQRVAMLSNCSYAYCEPSKNRAPFHLVIARRPQTSEGFSLHRADRIYFQPAAWRQAEVPLYIPWGTELAPRIDSRDAVELLHRFLEVAGRTDQDPESLQGPPPVVLWDLHEDGEICETRVSRIVKLLDNVHVLNAFSRETAQEVARSTRDQLERGLQEARTQIDDQLDQLTQELYGHVVTRTTQIEKDFNTMHTQLKEALTLVGEVQTDAQKVTTLVQSVPADWVTFVGRVMDVHGSISQKPFDAYKDLRNRLQPTRDQLQMLALRGRNLAEMAAGQRQRLEDRIQQCNQLVIQTDSCRALLEDLAPRVATVVGEVFQTHDQLRDRLDAIDAQTTEANRMEQEIDECEERERGIKTRLDQLMPEHQRCQRLDADVKRLDQEIGQCEEQIRVRSLELAGKQQLRTRCAQQLTTQLQAMEVHLRRIEADNGQAAELSEALAQESLLLSTQAQAVERWERQAHRWRQELAQQLHTLRERLSASPASSDARMQVTSLLDEAADLLDGAAVAPFPA